MDKFLFSLNYCRQTAIAVLFLGFLTGSVSAQPDGAALFKAQCAQCHTVSDKVVIGPGLKGIEQRRPEDWLIAWVKNSQAMIKSGDEYGTKLFNEYNKVVMPNFNLSDEEIRAIFAYAKAEAEKVPASKVTVAADGSVSGSGESGNLPLILSTVAIILLLIITILTKVKRTLENVLRDRQGLEPLKPVPMSERWSAWAGANKRLIAGMIIVLSLVGMKEGWDSLAGIGIYEGYQPEQPIAFSHEVHAGINGISCQYCHSSAEKGKTAGIPSPNVCMNCHSYIQEGPVAGKTEIAKIYKAMDYDPATRTYGSNQVPVQWIKVHNLPDHVYFNHSQHVKVAGLDCQTCHGKVEEMTVAKQHAPLTMGWCIDCHLTTEVKMENNGYYTEFHKKLVEKLGAGERITVDKIGGLECAKCHY
jgi:mono/diheme cytochrome c family protein